MLFCFVDGEIHEILPLQIEENQQNTKKKKKKKIQKKCK